MFSRFKTAFQKIYQTVTEPFVVLWKRSVVDEACLLELERILIGADLTQSLVNTIIERLRGLQASGVLKNGEDVRQELRKYLLAAVSAQKYNDQGAAVTLLVGVNGSGKTTCAAKLAYRLKHEGHRVLLVAADTFRAAAVDQLSAWGTLMGVDVHRGTCNQDPAAVVYTACRRFLDMSYDRLIIDTAGRLQTKANLMKELEKIRRVVAQLLVQHSITTLLTIDAILGQNSRHQAEIFHESTPLNGLILTKMDGTGKAGVVFSIVDFIKVPVAYVSYGEEKDALVPFDPVKYVEQILGSSREH